MYQKTAFGRFKSLPRWSLSPSFCWRRDKIASVYRSFWCDRCRVIQYSPLKWGYPQSFGYSIITTAMKFLELALFISLMALYLLGLQLHVSSSFIFYPFQMNLSDQLYSLEAKEAKGECKPFIFSFLSSSPEKSQFIDSLTSHPQIFLQILNDLKSYTPYSIPFLQKVSKRDAPDYYDIIKESMDLSLMTRKVPKYVLKSFISDLNLIWNNCFVYNISNIYTEYAVKMKQMSDYLTDKHFNKKSIDSREQMYYKMEVNRRGRNTKDMGLYFKQGEYLPEILFPNNTFPLFRCNNPVEMEVGADDIEFGYHKAEIYKDCFYIRRKRIKAKGVTLDEGCVKGILEHIICVTIYKTGYKKVQKSAIKTFAGLMYFHLLECMKESVEKGMKMSYRSIRK